MREEVREAAGGRSGPCALPRAPDVAPRPAPPAAPMSSTAHRSARPPPRIATARCASGAGAMDRGRRRRRWQPDGRGRRGVAARPTPARSAPPHGPSRPVWPATPPQPATCGRRGAGERIPRGASPRGSAPSPRACSSRGPRARSPPQGSVPGVAAGFCRAGLPGADRGMVPKSMLFGTEHPFGSCARSRAPRPAPRALPMGCVRTGATIVAMGCCG